MKVSGTSRAGYQYLICPDCDTHWIQETRDALSMSSEHCPNEECDGYQPSGGVEFGQVKKFPLMDGKHSRGGFVRPELVSVQEGLWEMLKHLRARAYAESRLSTGDGNRMKFRNMAAGVVGSLRLLNTVMLKYEQEQ